MGHTRRAGRSASDREDTTAGHGRAGDMLGRRTHDVRSDEATILALQRAAGNRAVAAALRGTAVQRSCGLGGPGHEPGARPGPGKPHAYKVETPVPGKSPEQVRREMRQDASKVAPYAEGEVTDGGVYKLPGLGSIKIQETEDGFVNVTQPDHLLHPGYVKTTVKSDGEGGSIVTRDGEGTGRFGRTNTFLSGFLWASRMDSSLGKTKEKT